MTTEAGRRLLDEAWDNFDAEPWGSMADHVAAIEAEARAALLAELEAGVEAMYLPFGNDLRLDRVRDETLAAVLDLIRKAGA